MQGCLGKPEVILSALLENGKKDAFLRLALNSLALASYPGTNRMNTLKFTHAISFTVE